MHLKSRVRRANRNPKDNTMVTNVPTGIIVYLQIKHGDKIEWRMERIGEQRVVIVSKI